MFAFTNRQYKVLVMPILLTFSLADKDVQIYVFFSTLEYIVCKIAC